jgi:hypothetical protein
MSTAQSQFTPHLHHPERTLLYQTIDARFETWFELASSVQMLSHRTSPGTRATAVG